jgi:sugar diacid utilization regulator
MRGDFFINSLYIVKDDYEEMKKVFEFYINTGSAGVCIIDEYISEIPKEIKKMADINSYPILFINKNIPYGEIIRTTTEMILLEKIDTISEMRIDRLLNENLEDEEVTSLAMRINGAFKSYYSALYISFTNFNKRNLSFIRNEISNNYEFEAVQYKNNIVVVVNFNRQVMMNSYINYISEIIEKHSGEFRIGVSNIFTDKKDFNYCIKEAFNATEISEIIKEKVVHYKDLSVYKLIYPIKNSRIIKDYYNETIEPLKEYDRYYNSNILETVENFIEQDGDYKKTASLLEQHENTVRYRVLKAKKLLGLENSHFKFIEQISIGLKIDKIFMDKKQ